MKTVKDFEESQRLINSVFRTDRRLPEQVFNQAYSDFVFEEFDWAMSSEFWETIKRLSIATQDSYIITAVLEPSPTDYYFSEFGYYNWLKLPVNISEKDYWKALESGPKSSPADAILHNSNVVVWLSSSMKWAVWGEREYGVCVLAFKKGSDICKTPILGSWRAVNEAIVDLLHFRDKKVLEDFSHSLRFNYSCIRMNPH